MLFTLQVTTLTNLQQHEIKALLVVRYCCTLSEEASERHLSLQDLEWESPFTGTGRSKKTSLHYAFIVCNRVVQRVENRCHSRLINIHVKGQHKGSTEFSP